MQPVGDEGGRADPLAHADAVLRDDLVADRTRARPRRAPTPPRRSAPDAAAGGSPRPPPAMPRRRSAPRSPGPRRPRPGGSRTDIACRRSQGQPERDQQRDRGERVREVVDRVGEQRHGSRRSPRWRAERSRSVPGARARSMSRGSLRARRTRPRRRVRSARDRGRRDGGVAHPATLSSSARTSAGSNSGPQRSTIVPSGPIRYSHGSVMSAVAQQPLAGGLVHGAGLVVVPDLDMDVVRGLGAGAWPSAPARRPSARRTDSGSTPASRRARTPPGDRRSRRRSCPDAARGLGPASRPALASRSACGLTSVSAIVRFVGLRGRLPGRGERRLVGYGELAW